MTDSRAGISFGVPAAWEQIDGKSLDNPRFRKAMEPMAKRAGVSVDTLTKKFIDGAELMVYDIGTKDNFADNLSVSKAPATGLPRKGDLDGTFRRLGATADAFEDVTTPLGKGAAQYYTLPMSGVQVHGCMLVVPTPSGRSSVITVSAGSEQRARAVVKDITASLAKVS